jgi:putative transposase
VQWKRRAITIKKGMLHLANGRGQTPLVVPWCWGVPCQVEMGWDGMQYELRATYLLDEPCVIGTQEVAGVDLGEVHLAVAHDGTTTTILNGGYVRSVRRYQNKLKGKLDALIDRKKKGSRRRRRLSRSKKKQLRSIAHHLRDALHKQTTKLVSILRDAKIQTVAIGDLRDCRRAKDYGRKGNQRIYQMPSGIVRHMLTYKAQRLGMRVVLVNERNTTKTCPHCGRRYKPTGRMYCCRQCGFVYHRDGVGAINIRRTYTGSGPVVGAMASPSGVRYHPHMCCSTLLPGAA